MSCCGCGCAAILRPTALPDPCSSGLGVGQQAQLPDGTLWELVFDAAGPCGRLWVRIVTADVEPIRVPVRLATTAPILLTGLQAIDGAMTLAGDRVLVKDQTPGGADAANGLYLAEAGAWTRAPDMDATGEEFAGVLVVVTEGDTQHDTIWELATDGPIVVGATPTAWRQMAPEKYEEEGVPVATRPILNFVGPAVTAADDPANDRVNVTIDAAAGAGTAEVAFGTTDTIAGPVSGTTTYYLDPWFGGRPAGNDEVFQRAARAGTLRNMYVQATTGPVGGGVVFTLRKNGVDTGLTATLGAGATQAADLVNAVVVAAGDRLSLSAAKATAGAGAANVDVTLEFRS